MLWRLCKIYRLKPNDEFFLSLTHAEKGWLLSMVGQDMRDEFDEKLGFVEYLASFSNPEAVKQLIEERKSGRPPTDDEFSKMLAKEFGRDIKLPPKGSQGIQQ